MIKKIILHFWVVAVPFVGCSQKVPKSQNPSQKSHGEISFDGVWARNIDENALFIIKGDTIVNFEHGDRMRFKVVVDTMIIDYGGFLGKYLILKHSTDSLILRNEDNSITPLFRR